jgi:hypothetical protein
MVGVEKCRNVFSRFFEKYAQFFIGFSQKLYMHMQNILMQAILSIQNSEVNNV